VRLSLKESRAVADLAEVLYGFLPGSGNPAWKGHVSFKTVAESVGVGSFWQSGSKQPMITALLTRTLESRRDRFEALILEIVRAGIGYRQKQGDPVRPDEIDRINGHLLEVGFKFPDLWDSAFQAALSEPGSRRAADHIARKVEEEKIRISQVEERHVQLGRLRDRLFALHTLEDRQAAGRHLQSLLTDLFTLHGLQPRSPFRIEGEEIDGSFELDAELYLLEAKWETSKLSEAPLLIFRSKIEGRSTFTRGVFIAINGVTDQAQTAITRGKQPNFFLIDGHDLTRILSGEADLQAFLRIRRRLLAEEGRVVVPFSEAWARRQAL
jgi:hypothetical protein